MANETFEFIVYARMDEAVQHAKPDHYIVAFDSRATGTVHYGLTKDIAAAAQERKNVVIMRKPLSEMEIQHASTCASRHPFGECTCGFVEQDQTPEQPATITGFIDITPPGLKTLDGQKRVATAQSEWEFATAELANLAERIVAANSQSIAAQDHDDYLDFMNLKKERQAKQEAFLRAVAGQ